MALKEIRCQGCNKLLGKIDGEGASVCPRCGGLTVFNTNTDENKFIPKKQRKPSYLKDRMTSSGVTFR